MAAILAATLRKGRARFLALQPALSIRQLVCFRFGRSSTASLTPPLAQGRSLQTPQTTIRPMALARFYLIAQAPTTRPTERLHSPSTPPAASTPRTAMQPSLATRPARATRPTVFKRSLPTLPAALTWPMALEPFKGIQVASRTRPAVIRLFLTLLSALPIPPLERPRYLT